MAGTAITAAGQVPGARVEHRPRSEIRKLRLQHNKVITDLETLRTALGTDGGASLGAAVILANELHDDHEAMVTFLDELDTDGAADALWETEVDGDLDDINDFCTFEWALDGVIGGDYAIAAASAVTLAMTGRIMWRRAGQIYETAITGNLIPDDDGDIANPLKFRAWRVEIDDEGTVSCVASGNHNSSLAEQALLTLGAKARTASTVEIGYIVMQATASAAFNLATDDTDALESFAWYPLKVPRQRAGALSADMSVDLAIGGTNKDEYSHGTLDVKIQGVKVTQVALDADVPFTVADTVSGATKFGGHLVLMSLTPTAPVTLATDGIAEASSDMTHADSPEAHTALDNVQDRIPAIFPVLGRIVTDSDVATFTFNTSVGDGTHGTFVFTSESYIPFDRTDQSGTGQGWDQPTIPDSVTAPFVAAGVVAANVVGLGSNKLSTSAVNAAVDMTAATVNA